MKRRRSAVFHEKREGVYTCRLCGLPLFKAVAKFESRTGLASPRQSFRFISGAFKMRAMAWSERRLFVLVAARLKVMISGRPSSNGERFA